MRYVGTANDQTPTHVRTGTNPSIAGMLLKSRLSQNRRRNWSGLCTKKRRGVDKPLKKCYHIYIDIRIIYNLYNV